MKTRDQGSALILSIFFMSLLFLLAVTFLTMCDQELNSAGRQRVDLAAHYAADAGIMDSIAFLEEEGASGVPDPDGITRTGTLGQCTWSCEIVPDNQTYPIGTNPLRVYTLTSTSALFERDYRRMVVTVGNDSFSKYVWYQDRREPALALPIDEWEFDGPVHFNSPMRVRHIDNTFWDAGLQPFQSTLESATPIDAPTSEGGEGSSVPAYAQGKDGVKYIGWSGNNWAGSTMMPYDDEGDIPERYDALLAQGRNALRTGVERVELPEDAADILRDAAWDTDLGPYPAATGVYIQSDGGEPAGGVFIKGTAATRPDVELKVTKENPHQQITLGTSVYHVVEVTNQGVDIEADLGLPSTAFPGAPTANVGQTLLVKATAPYTYNIYNGEVNGVVFSTDTVKKLWGVNKGPHTVAADIENYAEVKISEDIVNYEVDQRMTAVKGATWADTAYAPSFEEDYKSTTIDHNFGIVAWRVKIEQPGANGGPPRSGANPLFVYATMFGGHKQITDPTDPNYDGGKWNAAGPGDATGPSSTAGELGGFYTDNGGLGSGEIRLMGGWQIFDKNGTNVHDLYFSYDPMLAIAPPPAYPSNRKLSIKSWVERTIGG